jgi:hypothetical protein
MKNIFLTSAYLLLISLISCGIPKEDYDQLKSDNDTLSEEIISLKEIIDEFENGEPRLIALVEKSYEKKNFQDAIKYIQNLKEKHPEASKNKEFESLLITINKEIENETKRLEEVEEENFRLANLDNTGMWTNTFYVDDFGNPTKDGYIVNTSLITGTFSNSATTNSDLNVKFLISNSNDISIILYEYAGNNPVKSYGSTEYSVLVLDNKGQKLNLNATNYSDRLALDASSSRKLNSSLLKGGDIQFSIKEKKNSINKYEFVIPQADFYENALKKLKED